MDVAGADMQGVQRRGRTWHHCPKLVEDGRDVFGPDRPDPGALGDVVLQLLVEMLGFLDVRGKNLSSSFFRSWSRRSAPL